MADREALNVDVLVETWPATTGVIVRAGEQVVGHYEPTADPAIERGEPASSPLFDLTATYEERRDAAIAALEDNQEYLRICFGAEERPVCLHPDDRLHQQALAILEEFEIPLDALRLPELAGLGEILERRSLDEIFELLRHWHDVIELRAEPGASDKPDSWVQRARPDNCFLFHYLAVGLSERAAPGTPEAEAAYSYFRSFCNPQVSDFSLGSYLRWHYYHRAEFPHRDRPPMQAISEARALVSPSPR